jgi:hypothetical protein
VPGGGSGFHQVHDEKAVSERRGQAREEYVSGVYRYGYTGALRASIMRERDGPAPPAAADVDDFPRSVARHGVGAGDAGGLRRPQHHVLGAQDCIESKT